MRLSIGYFVQLFKTDDLLACFGQCWVLTASGQLSACAEGAALPGGGAAWRVASLWGTTPGEGPPVTRPVGSEHRLCRCDTGELPGR